MDDLYRDFILEHYKRPRNFGELEPHDHEAHEVNPLCGDELGVQIAVADGRIADLRFQGHGCAISQAAASMASEELIGMEVDEAALPVVLSLLDQLYDLRRQMRDLGDALARHAPSEVRRNIAEHLAGRSIAMKL